MDDTIDLYEAIRQMRLLSSKGKTFSFVHATWDYERMKSGGLRNVQHARLRPAAKGDDLANADFKLFYFDEDIKQPRNCWQMLLMFFNNKRVILN